MSKEATKEEIQVHHRLNPHTGVVWPFDDIEKAVGLGFTVQLDRKPTSNCKKCSGRGRLKVSGPIGAFVVCPCTVIRLEPLPVKKKK